MLSKSVCEICALRGELVSTDQFAKNNRGNNKRITQKQAWWNADFACALNERNTSSNAGRACNIKFTEVTMYFPDKKEFLVAE